MAGDHDGRCRLAGASSQWPVVSGHWSMAAPTGHCYVVRRAAPTCCCNPSRHARASCGAAGRTPLPRAKVAQSAGAAKQFIIAAEACLRGNSLCRRSLCQQLVQRVCGCTRAAARDLSSLDQLHILKVGCDTCTSALLVKWLFCKKRMWDRTCLSVSGFALYCRYSEFWVPRYRVPAGGNSELTFI